jgi:8-oxo-dGTP diphosphatase
MRAYEFITESTNAVQGPFKVTAYDANTRTVTLAGQNPITLGPGIADQPTPGYNYAFQMSGGVAQKLILLTADNVITTGTEILLIRRRNQPYAGHWALPGGFIDPGESPEQAARRELAEETGLQTSVPMKFVGRFDTPGRDPRMADVWSYAYATTIPKEAVHAGDDASAATWVPYAKLSDLPLAFDHAEIIKRAGIGQVSENFKDGKGPGRPGDSQRHGIPKKASMSQLEKASHAKGRKGQLARWQLNMRRGRAKKS